MFIFIWTNKPYREVEGEKEREREMVAAAYAMQSWSRISYKQQQEDSASSNRSRGMVVHVGSMPLRAPPGPAQWALLSADRLLSIQHFYTILQPISYFPSEQSPVTCHLLFSSQSNVCANDMAATKLLPCVCLAHECIHVNVFVHCTLWHCYLIAYSKVKSNHITSKNRMLLKNVCVCVGCGVKTRSFILYWGIYAVYGVRFSATKPWTSLHCLSGSLWGRCSW